MPSAPKKRKRRPGRPRKPKRDRCVTLTLTLPNAAVRADLKRRAKDAGYKTPSAFVLDAVHRRKSVNIGDLTLRLLPSGTLWLEHAGGDGMEVHEPTLHAELTAFYTKHF